MRRVISLEDGSNANNSVLHLNDNDDRMSSTSTLSDNEEQQQPSRSRLYENGSVLQRNDNDDGDDRASQTSSRDWGWFDDNDHLNTPRNSTYKKKDDYYDGRMHGIAANSTTGESAL